eukprot:s661_g4.t1
MAHELEDLPTRPPTALELLCQNLPPDPEPKPTRRALKPKAERREEAPPEATTKSSTKPRRKAKIKNVPGALQYKYLKELLEKATGPIKEGFVDKDATAWLVFERAEDATALYNDFNGGEISGESIEVELLSDSEPLGGMPEQASMHCKAPARRHRVISTAACENSSMSGGPPPAALLQFLGEAPSAAALRRPSSGAAHAQPPRGLGEDSSPDSLGLPYEDGGFDDCAEYSGAMTAETELLANGPATSAGGTAKARSQKPVRPAKPPKVAAEPTKAPACAGYAPPAPGKRTGSKPPEIEDFSKTTTPLPEGALRMLGEDSPSGIRKGQARTRPRSGSRSRGLANSGSMRDLDETPPTTAASATVDYDPMGSSGRRRFGGRG